MTDADFDIEVIDTDTVNLCAFHAAEPDLLMILSEPIGVYDQDIYLFINTEINLLRSRLDAKRYDTG